MAGYHQGSQKSNENKKGCHKIIQYRSGDGVGVRVVMLREGDRVDVWSAWWFMRFAFEISNLSASPISFFGVKKI